MFIQGISVHSRAPWGSMSSSVGPCVCLRALTLSFGVVAFISEHPGDRWVNPLVLGFVFVR